MHLDTGSKLKTTKINGYQYPDHIMFHLMFHLMFHHHNAKNGYQYPDHIILYPNLKKDYNLTKNPFEKKHKMVPRKTTIPQW